jgi:hypothetical protein
MIASASRSVSTENAARTTRSPRFLDHRCDYSRKRASARTAPGADRDIGRMTWSHCGEMGRRTSRASERGVFTRGHGECARVIRGRVARTLLYPNSGETAKGRAAQAASGERLVRWGREADTRDAWQRAFRVFVFPRGQAYLS